MTTTNPNVQLCISPKITSLKSTYILPIPMSATPNRTRFHCSECKKVFNSSEGLRKHCKDPERHNDDVCKESGHDHQLIQEAFASMDEAREWVRTQELDKYYTVYRSSKTSAEYQCRLNRAKKNSNHEVKTRHTLPRVPHVPCAAKFLIIRLVLCKCTDSQSKVCTQSSEVFRVRGCIRHSHEIKTHHFRMACKTKATLISLLQSGVPKKTILRQHCSGPASDKVITAMDLRNLERMYVNKDLLTFPKELRDRRQRAIEIVAQWKDALEKDASVEHMNSMVEVIEKFHNETPDDIRKSVCPTIKKTRKQPSTVSRQQVAE
ncbi:uncharacterized protein LOC131881769 isoform X2 [Tigriopus californicus]|uniref:uncharacterized protein LOC131881769 isoform X2 n=1 Tax=Tigriopus californicus TaxID=6832 RepID=UPI0027D9EFAD|nr:uncharacterized protein LOC131881769 isoform X2 [Tigriopus californicus]